MALETQSDVRSNVQAVLEAIERATADAGRPSGAVCLVAVSKMVGVEKILEAIACGVNHIGENRVQEALHKCPRLADSGATLHMIGPLQKNKANRAVEIFNWIDSLDDLDLATRLDRACERLDKRLPVLVQINVGQEATKSGISEDRAIDFIHEAASFKRLSIRGLMTIPPYFDNADEVRPYFARVRRLAEEIDSRKFANVSMSELSMGMSHDFIQAIQEGSTFVRVGTAIFGARY